MTIPLKIAVAGYPHTQRVKDGSIPIQGVAPEFVTVKPQIAAYRRMVRGLEFDVCELAPTTYLIARSVGVPIIALPVFLFRRFHHSGLLVRPDALIRHPKDLEGKNVGVRAYSVTTGVWTRGILIDEFGLDSSRVTWVVDDEEHVKELRLPPNVEHAPEGKSLAGMMASGELAAGFAANAGVGRSGSPTGGAWKQEEQNYPELFPDWESREAEWFARTRIYPMHGTLVVKEQLLRDNPWLARSLYDAFLAAKNEWLKDFASGASDTPADRKYRQHAKIVGPDPLPYGMNEANLPAMRALIETAYKQRLIPRPMTVADAFVDAEAN